MVDRLRKLAQLRTARYDMRLKGIYLGEGIYGAPGLARVGGGGHVERLGIADLGEQARVGRVEGQLVLVVVHAVEDGDLPAPYSSRISMAAGSSSMLMMLPGTGPFVFDHA